MYYNADFHSDGLLDPDVRESMFMLQSGKEHWIGDNVWQFSKVGRSYFASAIWYKLKGYTSCTN